MKKVTTLLAVMTMLALPAAAFAQDLGYGSPGGTVETTIDNGNEPGPSPSPEPRKASNSAPAAATDVQATDEGGSLPFTGLEVGLVAIAGLALLATGFGLRKVGGARSAG